jgi:FkbM family methyltransferase
MPRRPMRDLKEFCEYLNQRNLTPETVIDVGACYGTPELYSSFPNSYHVLFEPVSALEPHLKAITDKYHGEYHLMALSDKVGESPMTVVSGAPQGSSLIARPGAQTVMVPVQTLDNYFGNRDFKEPILLKTDCQGYDMHVMRGGRNFLKRVDVVVCEVNMFHPAGDDSLPDFGDSVIIMRELGFAVYDVVSYQSRPFDDALGYVDLVFARDNGPLRAHHRWA